MKSELQKSLWELGFLPRSFMERESSGSCLYHVSWRGSVTVLNDGLLSPNRSPHISTHSLHMHAYSLLLICISSASAKRTTSLLLQDLYQCVKKKTLLWQVLSQNWKVQIIWDLIHAQVNARRRKWEALYSTFAQTLNAQQPCSWSKWVGAPAPGLVASI